VNPRLRFNFRAAARRRAALSLLACFGLGCVLGLASCAGGVGDAELEQPLIALIYWSDEAARAKIEEADARYRRPQKHGVAFGDDLGRLFGIGDAQEGGSWKARFPGHIGLADPATGTIRRLEVAPAGAVPLDWSADHNQLLYSAKASTGYWQLYIYDVRTQDVVQVTHGYQHHSRGALGPAGELAFTRAQKGLERALLVQDSRAEEPRLLFEGVYVERVSWSPGGDMLVAAVEEPSLKQGGGPARRTLFAISPDAPTQTWPPSEGTALRSLGRGMWPAYGTIDDWFVYTAQVGTAQRLRLMRPESGARRGLGDGVRDEVEAALSPDGTLVAYISAENRVRRLFVRRINGTGERMIVTEGMAAHPVW
jgi:hypothetical protein